MISYPEQVVTCRGHWPTSLKQNCALGTLKTTGSPPLDPDPRPHPAWLPQVSSPCPVSYRFSSNSIGDGGAKALAEALKVNQGLESLE